MKNAKLLFAILLSLLSFSTFAQGAKMDTIPPYKRFTTLPTFRLLELDSTTFFTTDHITAGHVTVLMMFSPDCDHCRKQTEKFLAKMDSLKNVQFYMITPMSIAQAKEFSAKLDLTKYKNVHLYKDYQWFYANFFKVETVPFFAIYDKKKKFVELLDGNLKIDDLIKLDAK